MTDAELIRMHAQGVIDRGWNSPEQLAERDRLNAIAGRLEAEDKSSRLWKAAAEALNGLTVAPEVPFAEHQAAIDLLVAAASFDREHGLP